MKKNLLFAVLVVFVPSFAMAHVSVRPRESKRGAEEQSRYGFQRKAPSRQRTSCSRFRLT